MRDWPRLSVASLKAIELAEQEAGSLLWSSVRPYTPLNPKFRRTRDNLREGGYRAIDYVCAYAETLFDAFAGEYADRDIEITVLREVLAQRVAAEVERKAWNAWGGWLFATSIMSFPRVGTRGTLPGDIRFGASPELVRQGIEEVVIRFAKKPSDPKLGAILLQLQERFRTQLQNLLQARTHHWENRGGDKSPQVNVQPLDTTKAQENPPDRPALIDAFILKCRKETSLKATRTQIWRAVGHKTPRQFQYWQASDPKATAQDDQNFRRILAMEPTDFVELLKKLGIVQPES
jgi:hypothetical protein